MSTCEVVADGSVESSFFCDNAYPPMPIPIPMIKLKRSQPKGNFELVGGFETLSESIIFSSMVVANKYR